MGRAASSTADSDSITSRIGARILLQIVDAIRIRSRLYAGLERSFSVVSGIGQAEAPVFKWCGDIVQLVAPLLPSAVSSMSSWIWWQSSVRRARGM